MAAKASCICSSCIYSKVITDFLLGIFEELSIVKDHLTSKLPDVCESQGTVG